MPTTILLCGPPGSGKTTFRQQYLQTFTAFSTDDLILAQAKATGTTYDSIFKDYYKAAEKVYNETLDDALSWEINVVIDRTHVTPKSRMRTLAKLPKLAKYTKVAINFYEPLDTLNERIMTRVKDGGHAVPPYVVEDMYTLHEYPSIHEGFDLVLDANAVPNLLKVFNWK